MQIASGANLALHLDTTTPYMIHITTLMFLFGVLSYLGLQVMPASLASRQPLLPYRERSSHSVGSNSEFLGEP